MYHRMCGIAQINSRNGICYQHGGDLSPGGAHEPSPALQRWVKREDGTSPGEPALSEVEGDGTSPHAHSEERNQTKKLRPLPKAHTNTNEKRVLVGNTPFAYTLGAGGSLLPSLPLLGP